MSESEEDNEAGEPMGSVAYALAALAVPAVLAMTHSLLVETAGQLFGEFYRHLVEGKGVGAALDNARYYVMRNPEKHEVQRGSERLRLFVQDWFLPTLYQRGLDVPLLDASVVRGHRVGTNIASEHERFAFASANIGLTGTLPKLQTAGFFGRQQELWEIERWFVAGTRRISITGFGGQGKTYLAAEAARWLLRTGMFECVAFVDFTAFQGVDPRGYALATLGTMLGESLPDGKTAMRTLKKTPTLLILDNLEDLQNPHKPSLLNELLSEVKTWSECGGSRVLLTSRAPNFQHADYDFSGNLKHRGLALAGLNQDDALNYFQSVMKLPPAPKFPAPDRDALLKLFEMVDFHPLSIHLLAVQLKTRRVMELGTRLESLLAADSDDKNSSLLASLVLSLDRIDPGSWKSLTRLGVFQRGAMEYGLMLITEAELRFIQANFHYDILGEISIGESKWTAMREQLEAAALIAFESLDGVFLRYVRFHPTLAPLLWSLMPQPERDALTVKHRLWYYQLSAHLYNGDPQHPDEMRAIARCELPNLLHAVQGALEAGEEWAVRFSHNVIHFLNLFGLTREAATLTGQIAAWRENGSIGDTKSTFFFSDEPSKEEAEFTAWQLAQSNRGERLLQSGNPAAAANVFQELLDKLGDSPSFERCQALDWLGRCFHDLGQLDQAEMIFRDALSLVDVLERTDVINRRRVRMGGPDRSKHQRGLLQTDLGSVLLDMGRYGEAQAAYYSALVVTKEFGDESAEGTITGQLGTLALRQTHLAEAVRRYEEAISIFQRLNEPVGEAVYRHQLGMAFHQAGQWEAAEEAYRESARIRESLGDLSRAADAWDLLGQVSSFVDKPQAAEAWFLKALETRKQAGDRSRVATTLHNLATLLQHQPNRLIEARQLAEESLVIKQTLKADPGSAEIWNNYTTLAEIAGKQNRQAQAKKYRRQAREAWQNFAGSHYVLEQNKPLIGAVITTVFQPQLRPESEPVLAALEQQGKADLVAAIRRILDGERDAEALCESLGVVDSDFVEVILNSLKNPANIKTFGRR
jgi:tetratricopeptide (TPR) repeat protein